MTTKRILTAHQRRELAVVSLVSTRAVTRFLSARPTKQLTRGCASNEARASWASTSKSHSWGTQAMTNESSPPALLT